MALVSYKEAKILIRLFPEDSIRVNRSYLFYLIESVEKFETMDVDVERFEELINLCSNEKSKAIMKKRLGNYKDMLNSNYL